MEGWFNFTSSGCTSCDCDTVGSDGVNCSVTGQCSCKVMCNYFTSPDAFKLFIYLSNI